MIQKITHPSEDPFSHTKAPWWSHFAELKKRVVLCVVIYAVAFGISLYFAEDIYRFLAKPLATSFEDQGDLTRKQLVYTSLTEAFTTYLHLAFSVAWMVALPFMATQIYGFIAPGLHAHEKRSILPYLLIAPLLFFAGAALCYYSIFPLAWKFFLSFETSSHGDVPILLLPKMNEYLTLVIQCMMAFGLAFQLPVLLMLLGQLRIVTPAMLKAKRKYAIVIIFAVAAIITPPDAISQISLAVPMIILYEIAIIGIKMLQRKDTSHA